MRFCDADACANCPMADRPNIAPCLRQKAQFCMWLSTMPYYGSRAALEELSFELMEEACAVEKEFDFTLYSPHRFILRELWDLSGAA
jgi:hypothetical protein